MIIPKLITREYDSQPSRAGLAANAVVYNSADGFNIALPFAIAALAIKNTDIINAFGFRSFTVYVGDGGANRMTVTWFPVNPITPISAPTMLLGAGVAVPLVGTTTIVNGREAMTYVAGSANQGVLGLGFLQFAGAAGAATSIAFLGPMIFSS